MSTLIPRDRGRLVVPAMILAVSMSFIDQTIVAIASPTLQRDLHLSATQGQWAVNAYTVALASTFALGGRLADTWGRRRMALIGVIGFAVSSLLCAATPATGFAETWLITARATQGVFAALLMPAAITTVFTSASLEKRGRSMAAFFGVSGAFIALGPVIGSYLLDWSWRLIFWINVPVAIGAVVLILMADIPANRLARRIDWAGATLVAAAMSASVIGFTQSAVWGWGSLATWACIAAGALFLAAFVVVERIVPEPLVDLRIFRSQGLRVDCGALFLAMIGFVPVAYLLSMYADISLGEGAGGANILLLTFFIGFFVAAQVGGRIFDAHGAKPAILLGCLVAAAGFAWWSTQVTSLDASWSHRLPLVVAGAGIGLLLGPSGADAVSRADASSYGEVTGVNQTVRNYGAALGFAILGTILTHVFTSRFTESLVGLGVPRTTARDIATNADAGSTVSSSAVPASLRGAVQQAVAHDFASGLRVALLAMAAALVLAFLVALRHPGDRPAAAPIEEPIEEPVAVSSAA
jgi:EmrB/QacA subfamily drug resistance transporter